MTDTPISQSAHPITSTVALDSVEGTRVTIVFNGTAARAFAEWAVANGCEPTREVAKGAVRVVLHCAPENLWRVQQKAAEFRKGPAERRGELSESVLAEFPREDATLRPLVDAYWVKGNRKPEALLGFEIADGMKIRAIAPPAGHNAPAYELKMLATLTHARGSAKVGEKYITDEAERELGNQQLAQLVQKQKRAGILLFAVVAVATVLVATGVLGEYAWLAVVPLPLAASYLAIKTGRVMQNKVRFGDKVPVVAAG